MHPLQPPPRPGQEPARFWWVPPVLLTVVALPGSVFLLFQVTLVAMAFPSCPTGLCPRAELLYGLALLTALFSLVPVLVVWVLPRRRSLTPARWLLVSSYALCHATTLVLLAVVPTR